MNIENMSRIGVITRELFQAVTHLELLPEIVSVGFLKEPNFALGTQAALMPRFQTAITESPAAQVFIKAYKSELEAKIERLKKELETL